MSSVIKKSSQFLHLKKKPIKRKVNNNAAVLTPPPSQGTQDATNITESQHKQDEPVLATPDPTQSQTFEFKKSTNVEEDIDPMDATKVDGSVDEHSNLSLDEEIVTKPESRSRRTSEVAGRRLSGITPVAFRNRSASIISVSGAADSSESGKPPAKIGIPAGKVAKRRKSSVARVSARIEPIIPNLVSKEPSPVVEEQPEEVEEEIVVPPDDGTSEFVVAIDPLTNRLKKFRRKAEIKEKVEKNEEIPVELVKPEKPKETEPEPKEVQDDRSARRRKLRQQWYKDIQETAVEPKTDDTVEPQAEPESPVESGNDDVQVKLSPRIKRQKKIPVLPTASERVIKTSGQLPRNVKDEDAELYENIALDTNNFKLADLCKPSFPIGRLSSNFQRAQDAEKKMKLQKVKRREERETARKERIPLEEVIARSAEPESNDESKRKVNNLLNTDVEPANSTQLQMRLDHSGKMVVDEDSLTRNRHGNIDRSNRVVEEANPFENPVISTTYGKRRYTDRWTADEVKQFYVALSTFGTDFSMIAQLFPYRNRKQVKLKFNLEEKKYPEVIEMALKRKLPADFDKYCFDSGNKIETLDYYNSQLDQVRIEHQYHINQIEEEKEKAAREDAEASRQREIQIRTGSKMTKREKQQQYRKNEMVVGSIDDIKKQPVE